MEHYNWGGIFRRLEEYVPDISRQQLHETSTDYIILKRRLMHVFQFKLMDRLLNLTIRIPKDREILVVDIGDSAGTHMTYLRKANPDRKIRTISVNLCEEEVNRIKAKGMEAILCRAEELDLGDAKIAFSTSFEMVEHLHNPSLFFRRLAIKANTEYLIITVPYLEKSRIGLHRLRAIIANGKIPDRKITAEEEHIFELAPGDWELLVIHSGWSIIERKIYYQYPNAFPYNLFLKKLWRKLDFEGFFGLILKRDTRFMELYQAIF